MKQQCAAEMAKTGKEAAQKEPGESQGPAQAKLQQPIAKLPAELITPGPTQGPSERLILLLILANVLHLRIGYPEVQRIS